MTPPDPEVPYDREPLAEREVLEILPRGRSKQIRVVWKRIAPRSFGPPPRPFIDVEVWEITDSAGWQPTMWHSSLGLYQLDPHPRALNTARLRAKQLKHPTSPREFETPSATSGRAVRGHRGEGRE
ncbi:MAG: hypothetical protein NVS3B20_24930 [Polyangiales bacterium]